MVLHTRLFLFVCSFVCSLTLTTSWAIAQSQPGRTDFDTSDRLAIQNLIASHFLYLDSFQIDKWGKNFTADATFAFVLNGKRYESDKPVFEKFFRDRFRKFRKNGDQRRHVMSNIQFNEQTDKTAHINGNGLLISTNNGGKPELVAGMTIEGWFVKHDGAWMIRKWIVRGDTRNIAFERPKGMRVREDK